MTEQNFETMISKERDRLNKARQDVLNKQRELEKKLAEIDAEMRAIDAYEAVKQGKPVPGATTTAPRKSGGTRRTGIRDDILGALKKAPQGLTAAEVRHAVGIPDEDKSGAQSVANALANLKKKGSLTQSDDGKYIAK